MIAGFVKYCFLDLEWEKCGWKTNKKSRYCLDYRLGLLPIYEDLRVPLNVDVFCLKKFWTEFSKWKTKRIMLS